jgi:GNAT superfamily N-acetyltransferase
MRRDDPIGAELRREGSALTEIEIRSIGLDDYAAVRSVHLASVRWLAASFLDTDEMRPLLSGVGTIEYTDALFTEDLTGAWLGGDLVGTAGWLAADDSGRSARITSVFVRPLFMRIGVGRLLVREAEARARKHGYRSFSVRATPLSAVFFQRLGYEITSHGSMAVDAERSLPLTFLRRTEPAVVTTTADTAGVAGCIEGRAHPQRPVHVAEFVSAAAAKVSTLQKFAES